MGNTKPVAYFRPYIVINTKTGYRLEWTRSACEDGAKEVFLTNLDHEYDNWNQAARDGFKVLRALKMRQQPRKPQPVPYVPEYVI